MPKRTGSSSLRKRTSHKCSTTSSATPRSLATPVVTTCHYHSHQGFGICCRPSDDKTACQSVMGCPATEWGWGNVWSDCGTPFGDFGGRRSYVSPSALTNLQMQNGALLTKDRPRILQHQVIRWCFSVQHSPYFEIAQPHLHAISAAPTGLQHVPPRSELRWWCSTALA